MIVRFERPPNYDAIVAVFPRATTRGVLFCYGDAIYNPGKVAIPREIMAHEEVHAGQQEALGVEEWWRRYLIDTPFRYEQELAAHVGEWRAFLAPPLPNRAARRSGLLFIAKRLAGPLYGGMVSVDTATRLLIEAGGRT